MRTFTHMLSLSNYLLAFKIVVFDPQLLVGGGGVNEVPSHVIQEIVRNAGDMRSAVQFERLAGQYLLGQLLGARRNECHFLSL